MVNNPNISNVGGLTGLQNVTGSVNIQSNPALTNINGLSALTGVAGNFQIYSNAALTNVGGLTALATVGGYVNIQYNDALTNVDGLTNLTSRRRLLPDLRQLQADLDAQPDQTRGQARYARRHAHRFQATRS